MDYLNMLTDEEIMTLTKLAESLQMTLIDLIVDIIS